jgi:hypothetical protein
MEEIYRHLPSMTEVNYGNSVRIPDVTASTRTANFLNTSLEHYRHTSLLVLEKVDLLLTGGGRVGFRHGASPDMSF